MEVRTCAALTEVKRPSHVPHQAYSNRKDRLSRHASFSVLQPSEMVKRKVSSEPSSPHKERQGKCWDKQFTKAIALLIAFS